MDTYQKTAMPTPAPTVVDGDYAGYAEHQFLEAFDILCRKAGGFQNGKALAKEIINQQVQ